MKPLAEVTGLPLQWVQPSAWRETYELRAGDDVVASLRFRQSAQVTIQPVAVRLDVLPLLITLGWYLAVMMHQDSAVAVVVATWGIRPAVHAMIG
jgi:hypothetical protein